MCRNTLNNLKHTLNDMKHTLLKFAGILAIAFAWTPVSAQKPATPPNILLNGGPGIVISGSQTTENMPAAAQEFLKKNYPNDPVIKCHENFVKETYNVDLEDGTSIVFNHDGKVKDINAGDYATIPEATLSDILPAKTVKHLEQSGTAGLVTAIKNAGDKGFGVALLNNVPPQMIFDIDGTFIIVAE